MNNAESENKPASALFETTLRKHLGRYSHAVVASVMINLLTLATSFFAMQVYDRVVPNQAIDTLWVLFSGLIGAVLIETLLKGLRSGVLDLTNKLIEIDLSQKFFNKSLRIRMDVRPRTIGTFASQIREFELVKNFLTSSTLYALVDAPFALLFLLVILVVGGPELAIVPLLAMPVLILVGMIVQKPLARLSEEHMREASIRNGMLIESIDGVESLKATGGEGWFSQRWYQLGQLTAESGYKLRHLTNWLSYWSAAVQQIAYACMIVIGVFAIFKGELSMGGLIASSILINRVLSPMTQITSMAVNWYHARAALKGLNQIMSMPEAGPMEGQVPITLEQLQPECRLNNVVFHYQQDLPSALNVKDLCIRAGERVAVVGANGSGKSSMLKILSGLYKPGQGVVFFGGVDIHLLDPVLVRQSVGYLPQDVRLFNGTLKDNLTLGIHMPKDDDILNVCAMVGLKGLIDKHPRGINLEISEGGRGLSGGQRQAVVLARVLLQRPKLILLDEPTASMDPTAEMQLLGWLNGFITNEQTLVMVTHKPALLQLTSRILVMDQGNLVMDGPRDGVLAKLTQPAQKQASKETLIARG
jgi:ATP-binding cassette, subfamily C, bacterial LapB